MTSFVIGGKRNEKRMKKERKRVMGTEKRIHE